MSKEDAEKVARLIAQVRSGEGGPSAPVLARCAAVLFPEFTYPEWMKMVNHSAGWASYGFNKETAGWDNR